MREPKVKFIRPATIDVGRGPEVAKVLYPPTAGRRPKLLAPEGASVSMDGQAGAYWQRRINEGTVEVVAAKARETKKGSAE